MYELNWCANPLAEYGTAPAFLSAENVAPAYRFLKALPGYAPTPLISLPHLSAECGIRAIYVKDESGRFGQNSFKPLGAAYAVFRAVCERLGYDPEKISFARMQNEDAVKKLVFVAATDGNHGRAVAWAAKKLGCECHIFVPKGTVKARIQAIKDCGAISVEMLPLSYDDSVRFAASKAEEQGWLLIQDTSWPGYEAVPQQILQGYSLMASEAAGQLVHMPTHVFLQAGVGGMAAAVMGTLAHLYQEKCPCMVLAEPKEAACCFASVKAGDSLPHRAEGSEITISAGLNCSEPCPIAWDILKDLAAGAISCSDDVTMEGMKLLARPIPGDTPVTSGGSGAITTGVLHRLMTDPACFPVRDALGLGTDSVVLLFSTEGNTDPVIYDSIVGT